MAADKHGRQHFWRVKGIDMKRKVNDVTAFFWIHNQLAQNQEFESFKAH